MLKFSREYPKNGIIFTKIDPAFVESSFLHYTGKYSLYLSAAVTICFLLVTQNDFSVAEVTMFILVNIFIGLGTSVVLFFGFLKRQRDGERFFYLPTKCALFDVFRFGLIVVLINLGPLWMWPEEIAETFKAGDKYVFQLLTPFVVGAAAQCWAYIHLAFLHLFKNINGRVAG